MTREKDPWCEIQRVGWIGYGVSFHSKLYAPIPRRFFSDFVGEPEVWWVPTIWWAKWKARRLIRASRRQSEWESTIIKEYGP